jgi:hypothetical protein
MQYHLGHREILFQQTIIVESAADYAAGDAGYLSNVSASKHAIHL